MPPRGVKKGTKRARQYEHIKDSVKDRGGSEDRAEEIAARTVNKERARSGESRERSRTSTNDMSSSRRGGLRSGTCVAAAPTECLVVGWDQLRAICTDDPFVLDRFHINLAKTLADRIRMADDERRALW